MDKFSRTLTLRNSIFLGLSSMIGAGLFVNIAPTAKVASYSSVVGLIMASSVAFANASSSAQLARLYPETGGTYLYARNILGKIPSLIAGYSFIIGKSISCIVIALTLGNYLMPQNPKISAILLVVIVTLINFFGLERTSSIAKWFVYSVILILSFYIFSITTTSSFNIQIPITQGLTLEGFVLSSSIWFFAFTGYSRLATFGEEVKNPEKIIPQAILRGLGITVVVYLSVSWVTLGIVEPTTIANSLTPLKVAFDVSRFSQFSFLITICSTIATSSVLLALLPGISRVFVAMARDKNIPGLFKIIHPVHNSAYVADLSVLLLVVSGVLYLNIVDSIKLSAFFILIYYSITNLSILKLPKNKRLFPSFFALYGLTTCLILCMSLVLYF
ncbi:MAG: amino acid permease [Candidatus Actinomarinales bacterium]|nr:MAG: amino acid permease [Candidatus Actinomarinales bacterium]